MSCVFFCICGCVLPKPPLVSPVWLERMEYAWIVWSDPVVLALCKIWLWMVPWVFEALFVCVRMSMRRLECSSASLVMLDGVSLLVIRVWDQVLSPPTGGSASVNIMSGDLCPSTTLRADVSASLLCVTPVCDFTLPICILYPILSLVRMMLSASCKR